MSGIRIGVRRACRAAGRRRATLDGVRELRLVGGGPDGRSLVVELDGEHLLLPLDPELVDQVRDAVTAVTPEAPPGEPERIGPREIQRRIRTGETVAEVAAASGLDPAWVTRFAGPPFAERAYQAGLARAATIDTGSLDAATLEERVTAWAAATGAATAPPEWDSWLAEDGDWRVVAVLDGGVAACWSWRPAAARLTPVERTARLVTPGLGGSSSDVLQAVLRPVGPRPDDLPTSPAPTGPRRGRSAVPSWEEISSTITRPDA